MCDIEDSFNKFNSLVLGGFMNSKHIYLFMVFVINHFSVTWKGYNNVKNGVPNIIQVFMFFINTKEVL